MRKVIIGVVATVALIGGGYTVMSMTHVGQGEVGVVYSMKGGVKDKTLGPGLHFVGPTDKVKDYPVSQQQLVLSNNPSDYGEKKTCRLACGCPGRWRNGKTQYHHEL